MVERRDLPPRPFAVLHDLVDHEGADDHACGRAEEQVVVLESGKYLNCRRCHIQWGRENHSATGLLEDFNISLVGGECKVNTFSLNAYLLRVVTDSRICGRVADWLRVRLQFVKDETESAFMWVRFPPLPWSSFLSFCPLLVNLRPQSAYCFERRSNYSFFTYCQR